MDLAEEEEEMVATEVVEVAEGTITTIMVVRFIHHIRIIHLRLKYLSLAITPTKWRIHALSIIFVANQVIKPLIVTIGWILPIKAGIHLPK